MTREQKFHVGGGMEVRERWSQRNSWSQESKTRGILKGTCNQLVLNPSPPTGIDAQLETARGAFVSFSNRKEKIRGWERGNVRKRTMGWVKQVRRKSIYNVTKNESSGIRPQSWKMNVIRFSIWVTPPLSFSFFKTEWGIAMLWRGV